MHVLPITEISVVHFHVDTIIYITYSNNSNIVYYIYTIPLIVQRKLNKYRYT